MFFVLVKIETQSLRRTYVSLVIVLFMAKHFSVGLNQRSMKLAGFTSVSPRYWRGSQTGNRQKMHAYKTTEGWFPLSDYTSTMQMYEDPTYWDHPASLTSQFLCRFHAGFTSVLAEGQTQTDKKRCVPNTCLPRLVLTTHANFIPQRV